MFRAVNQATLQEWTVESRDDFLLELEMLQARRNPLDPPEEWTLYHVSEEGELLEKHSLYFPLDATIDLLLLDFGFQKKAKGGFLSRLFNRKASSKESPREENVEVLKEASNEMKDSHHQADSEEANIDQILSAAALHQGEIVTSEEEEELSETTENENENKDEEKQPESNDLTPHPLQEEESQLETVASEVQEEESSQEIKTAQMVSQSPSQHLLHVLNPRDEATTLSSWDLRLAFVKQMGEEIEKIDHQMKVLSLEKENQLRLLESIKTVRLQ